MRVLTLSGTRAFSVVLREYAASNNYDVILTNKNTDETSTINVTKTSTQIIDNMNQLEVPVTATYNEGADFQYKIIETGGSTILHRGKLFFTSQIPQDYTINE